MASNHQQPTPTHPISHPENTIKSEKTVKKNQKPRPKNKSILRQPDEIEEAEPGPSVPTSTSTAQPVTSKDKPKKIIPIQNDSDTDDTEDDSDIETVYLSSDDDDEEDDDDDDDSTDSDSDSDSDLDSDSGDSVESIPARNLARRQTGRDAKNNTSSPHFTSITRSRSETIQWVTTRQQNPPRGRGLRHSNTTDGTVTRGTRTVRESTTMHGPVQDAPSQSVQQPRASGGNSLRLNMSVNLNMQWSGLVTGQNLSLAGGSLSYQWSRRS